MPSSRHAVTHGVLPGSAAMAFVGGSVAVSAVLHGTALFAAQAIRYALACAILLLAARVSGRRLVVARGRDWFWLATTTASGLVLFNIALVAGSRHAEPAVLGVAVACVPVLLAALGPLLEGRRPSASVVVAAAVVTAGAALVQGGGRSDLVGLGWAGAVLACEAGFTLMALPLLGSQGPWGISVHSTGLAALAFAALGVVRDGPGAIVRLDGGDLLAVGYLAVAVTAVAFVLWYTAVRTLGAARAGLLTGVSPIAAAVSGVALGAPVPRPAVWLGLAVVVGGLALGLPGGAAQASTRVIETASTADAAAT